MFLSSELFVDKHQVELIHRVKNIAPIVDGLRSYRVLNGQSYDEIMSIPDSQGKMRALYGGPLTASGATGKKIFYKLLNEYEVDLINDLVQSVRTSWINCK